MSYDDEKPIVGESYKPKSRRCCIVSVLSVTLALLLILAIAIPLGIKNAKKDEGLNGPEAIDPACQATSYPDTCRETLAGSDGTPTGLSKVALTKADSSLAGLEGNVTNPECKALLIEARESVRAVFNQTVLADPAARIAACDDVQVKLSAAIEQVETCKAIFEDLQSPELHQFPLLSGSSTQLLSIALAFVNCKCKYGDDIANWKNTFPGLPEGFNFTNLFGARRRLLDADGDWEAESNEDINLNANLPYWIDSATSRHLLARPPWYNVIVAKDGSGRYKTVSAAIDAAPKSGSNSAKRYVIWVKAGVYNEQIIIPKKLTNLMIVGDGMDRTIFTGSRSVMLTSGMTTFLSATLIVSAPGFIGRFFTVRNTAGALGHQAVAMRVSADLAAFYRVKFDSFQDTLYCHTFRQFYRECIVTGTVDFIFGNGNAVFQNCQIIAKKSTLQGQQNTYTAQGKTDPHQNTGLAFQDCNFDGTADLKKNVPKYPSFLGRPWKAYSTCVLLRPTIQAHIDPKGWLPWNTTSFGLYTSFFAEYKGKGPGSSRRYRVNWSHEIKDSRVANRYQAVNFINGRGWLGNVGMPYSLASV